MNIAKKVSKYFDGIPNMAKKLGCTPQNIYQWPSDSVPKGAAYQIQVLTKNHFVAEKLMKGEI